MTTMSNTQTYFRPATFDQAIELSSRNSGSRFLAGGTDALVNKFQGTAHSDCLIDLSGIAELKQISREGDFLHIGSLVTLEDFANNEVIASKFPALAEAANSIASPVIRKSATVGGNILCENRCIFFNQSDWWREAVGYCLKCEGEICIATGGKKACFSKFVADLATALIAVNAAVEISHGKKSRKVPLEKLYTGDGVNPRNLKSNEIIRAIYVPLKQPVQCAFKKLRKRESVDFTSLTICASVNPEGKIKIVLGGVDPSPVIIENFKSAGRKELLKMAVKKSRIVDNDVFSRKYRKEMIAVYLDRIFDELKIEN